MEKIFITNLVIDKVRYLSHWQQQLKRTVGIILVQMFLMYEIRGIFFIYLQKRHKKVKSGID